MANRISSEGPRILMGRASKAGTAFTGMTRDVTSDVLRAVVDHIGVGRAAPVLVDGKPMYEIEVRLIKSDKACG